MILSSEHVVHECGNVLAWNKKHNQWLEMLLLTPVTLNRRVTKIDGWIFNKGGYNGVQNKK